MKLNPAIIHRQYVLNLNKSNNVGFIQKYWYLTKEWLKYERMPIFGHTWAPYVFGHFWTDCARNFNGNSGDYYLLIGLEKSKLSCLFSFLIFGRENKRGHHTGPCRSGASNPAKMLAQFSKFPLTLIYMVGNLGKLFKEKCQE